MSNFSFTITLKPCMYRYEPEEQYDLVAYNVYTLLKTLSNNFTLVAECTKNMNLHLHGIIELHTKKQWYTKFRKSDLFGFTVCREIYEMQKWKDYIQKDIVQTYRDLNRRPIINDDYKVFSSNDLAFYGCTF